MTLPESIFFSSQDQEIVGSLPKTAISTCPCSILPFSILGAEISLWEHQIFISAKLIN